MTLKSPGSATPASDPNRQGQALDRPLPHGQPSGPVKADSVSADYILVSTDTATTWATRWRSPAHRRDVISNFEIRTGWWRRGQERPPAAHRRRIQLPWGGSS